MLLSPRLSCLFSCIVAIAVNPTFLILVNPPPAHAALVETFIAAEYQEWDYAPSGMDLCTGQPLDNPASATWTTVGVGTKYTKARFIEYADDQYTTPLERPEEEEHLGILGPLIRVQVGDTLRVHFHNALDVPANMAIEGLAVLNAESANFEVAPNKSAVWTWQVVWGGSAVMDTGVPCNT